MQLRLGLIAFCTLMLVNTASFCQEEEGEETKGFDKSKLFFGGNFGVSFGNSTFVNLTPQVGYRFNNWLAAGTGINFIYSNFLYYDALGNKDYRYEYGSGGLNIFGRVYPVRFAFLQVQPEYNYTWGKEKIYFPVEYEQKLDGKFVPCFLIGAGAALPAGKGAIVIMVQYDVIQDPRSPYGRNAFFTFGVNF